MLRQSLCCLACICLLPGLAMGDALLVISRAVCDATADRITIHGNDLGKTAIVTFDLPQVDVRNVADWAPLSSGTCTKAILPSPAPCLGSHQICVGNKQAPLFFDAFAVTAGTVGPKGDTRTAEPFHDNAKRFVDWGNGTIPNEPAVRRPEYLLTEPQQSNLLADGSFEDGAKNWSPRSWRGSLDVSAFVTNVSKSGKVAAVLRSAVAEDAMLWQKVAVKPKSWYPLSGWVKTEKVVIQEKGGTMGVSLSVWGGYEARFDTKKTRKAYAQSKTPVGGWYSFAVFHSRRLVDEPHAGICTRAIHDNTGRPELMVGVCCRAGYAGDGGITEKSRVGKGPALL
jgi:hypothetical protein